MRLDSCKATSAQLDSILMTKDSLLTERLLQVLYLEQEVAQRDSIIVRILEDFRACTNELDKALNPPFWKRFWDGFKWMVIPSVIAVGEFLILIK